jgi:hypothetical protein
MNFEIYNKNGLDLALTSLQPFYYVVKGGLDLALTSLQPFYYVVKGGLDLAPPFPKVD